MELFFSDSQIDENSVENDDNYHNTELRDFMTDENVRLVEMQMDGSLTNYNTTFAIAV